MKARVHLLRWLEIGASLIIAVWPSSAGLRAADAFSFAPPVLVGPVVSDLRGNLSGDPARGFMDIVETTLWLSDNDAVLDVRMAVPLPSAAGMVGGKRFDVIWFVDIDRNLATGQSALGNDYNIHLRLDETGWQYLWFKVSPVSQADGIMQFPWAFSISAFGDRASLTFPRAYLPSGSLDLWATCTSANAPHWPPFTENPPTKKARYDLGYSQAPAVTVGESAGQVVLTVFRHAPAPWAASVDYESADQTALAGVDFQKTSGTLLFAAGETNRTITIPLLNDGLLESAETFAIRLSRPTEGARIGAQATMTVTITDNDPGFNFESSGVGADESVRQVAVTVLRQDDSARPAAIDYTTENGTALAGWDYQPISGTLVFAAGETNRTITIPILNDGIREDTESFTVRLARPTDGASLGAQAVMTVTITDNDPGFNFENAGVGVDESVGQVALTVLRQDDSDRPATIDYATENGTALAGWDYQPISGTLLFAAGETNRTIAIPILNDGIREDTESFTVRLSHPMAGTSLGSRSTASVYINDNDPGFTVEPYLVRAAASATQAVVRVLRQDDSGRPAAVDSTTVDGTALAGRDYSATTGTLRFAAGEGSRPIVIPLLADRPKDAPKSFTVRLRGPTEGTSLGTQAVATVEMLAASEVVAWGSNWSGQSSVPSGLSNIVDLAVGSTFSLALTAEGRVTAWGTLWQGQQSVPMTVPADLDDVVSISAGVGHALALTSEGRVRAWGTDAQGQTRVPQGLEDVVGIAAGAFHSLALTAAGKVTAWGYNEGGQASVPAGLGNIVSIAAGSEHSLALTAAGGVVAWGRRTSPAVRVPTGLSNVVGIAAGGGSSLALTADGRVVAWGYIGSDQAAVLQGLSDVVAIAGQSLAQTADGKVVDWGYTAADQPMPQGLSHVVAMAGGGSHHLALIGAPDGQFPPAWVGTRRLVGTAHFPYHHRIRAKNGVDTYHAEGLPPGLELEPASGLITGIPTEPGHFSIRVTATNRAGSRAWTLTLFVHEPAAPSLASKGIVHAGLGGGFRYAVEAFNVPERFEATGLPPGWSIDTESGVISGIPLPEGAYPVSLVVSNRSGVATGPLTFLVSPVAVWVKLSQGGEVSTEVPGGLSNIVAIAAGRSHNLALTAGGQVVAWGDNQAGQRSVPDGLFNTVAIAAGGSHSLALTAEGRVVSWGSNSTGQTNAPTGLSNVVAIAAGGYHNLALTAGGRVLAWGYNWLGQTNVPSDLPAAVGIAAGDGQSLVLTEAGEVMTWGRFGGPPYLAGAWSNIVTMASSFSYGGSAFYNRRWSVALTDDGQLVAWGETEDGDFYSSGPSQMPAGLERVRAVSVRGNNTLALTEEGRLLRLYLGTGSESEICEVANGLSSAVAIAAGEDHALVLFEEPTTVMPRLEWSGEGSGLELQARGSAGIPCLLLRAPELSGPWLPTQPVTITHFSDSRQQVRSVSPTEPAQFFQLRRR